jgi:membrane-bound lytic murein transglycosylase F
MRLLLITALLFLLHGCSVPTPLIDRIKASGELIVVTRNSGTTLYEGSNGLTGFEFDLVQLFANELGVKARFVIPRSFEDILPTVIRGDAHLAAAGLSITSGRETQLRFGPAYQEIKQQVVYLAGTRRPRNVKDLIGKNLEVIAGSSHEEELMQLSKEHPDLKWTAHSDLEVSELLQRVHDGEIDFAIADSNTIAVNRRFLNKIRVGFNLKDSQQLAWAMAHAEDTSLYKSMQRFFGRIRKDGTLAHLIERHYGHIGRLNFVESTTFIKHSKQRLPKYENLFKKASEETGVDWQMLAAIGYQESHWNPKAKSPTGVKGIMMLTLDASKEIGVSNRLDPEQSILGGARYLKVVEEKIPQRIEEPDRLWLTLAGYNVGFGHLEDARVLTERLGDNPDKWSDVKKHLPKLRLEKWHKTLKHGYARGDEPVKYVDNIRAYYELLRWRIRQRDLVVSKVQKLSYPLTITPAAL